jgi:hypothetical protein
MSAIDPDQLEQKTLEDERMHDVLLMLQHLSRNEEVTIKIIIDCLYDIGSINLINQKLPQPPVNTIVKQVARLSKPLFRIVAFRWFKKNGPLLITRWLRKKVSFQQPVANQIAQTAKQVEATLTGKDIELYSQSKIDLLSGEVQRLRSQVRLISGISIGAIVALGGVIMWMNYGQAERSAQQNQQTAEPLQVITLE